MSKFGQNWLIFARYKLQNLLQLVLKYIPCKWSLNEVIPQSFHTNDHWQYRATPFWNLWNRCFEQEQVLTKDTSYQFPGREEDRVFNSVRLGAHWCYFQCQVAPWKMFVRLCKMVKKAFKRKNIEKNPEKKIFF